MKAASAAGNAGPGPIAAALAARSFEKILLLSDHSPGETQTHLEWLRQRVPTPIGIIPVRLIGKTSYEEIYPLALAACERAATEGGRGTELVFHMSPGTPAMAAVWLLLAKTAFHAELIESSPEEGVKTVPVPFDISSEFLTVKPDQRLSGLALEPPPETPEFSAIVHRCDEMKRVLARAAHVAPRNLPVLIEGESGTGKELLARAIYTASRRRNLPFKAVNCGAIPSDLVESELFGHEKSAFTGANELKKGFFEAADRGTLFLDEIGELPQLAQVKLLRVLQQGEVLRVGSTQPVRVDVRIIAATNRNLIQEVSGGRFREDLFFRLAVAVLRLPPLRERQGDLGLLISSFLEKINMESQDEPGYQPKKLSPSARNVLLAHSWSGNARELLNTIRRAALWSARSTISESEMRESILALPGRKEEILNRPLGDGLDLQAILDSVAKHYLRRAMAEAHGNKAKASRLVGLASRQTFTNWLKSCGLV